MTVYVDDMYQHPMGRFGRMKMSHMVADTTGELIEMVDRIGVQRKWMQDAGTSGEHFDIAFEKRTAAIAAGAVPITLKQLACMCTRRQRTGSLGLPNDAIQWRQSCASARAAERDPAQPADKGGEP